MHTSERIRRLNSDIISKIAAGEVVVNPSSVVKELVENSLDATATSIEVQIRNGGKSYIKVSDNGIGMSKEDLILAIERYTTSKISSIEDIYSLYSYGFRGEALASIVEVSRTVITTSDGLSAHRLEAVAGKIVKLTETHRERGTTVEVYDLFFNIPARRKFLSSEKIEARMVTEVFEKFMLIRPDVKFLLKINDEVVYSTNQSNLSERFLLIFPEVREFRSIQQDFTQDVLISGIISSPQFTRKNRTGQLFFVNKRFVMDNLLHLSLERGYGESIAQGEHPYAVVFLDVPPDKIDVNIHPQKLQVKFSDPQIVYNELARTVRENIRKFSSYTMFIEKLDKGSFSESIRSTESENVANVRKTYNSFETEYSADFKNNPNKISSENSFKISETKSLIQPVFFQESDTLPREFITLKNRYILFEENDGITILDFHAAHERIIYEKLKERNFDAVQLLLSINLRLSKSLLQLAQELSKELEEFGFLFGIKTFEDGSGEVEIRQIPSILKVTDAAEVFLEVLEEYRIPFEKPKGLTYVLASKACKAAVKTGDKISQNEIKQLIQEIRNKNLLTCPHGRPIMMKIPFSQLDSYFERI
ncbi:MAG: DNA mismatch repair endonuclease MutL [Fervidobacterium sp.]|nr:DNA mismatch repair endonuclease MutL [Fervidobacterium sp.]